MPPIGAVHGTNIKRHDFSFVGMVRIVSYLHRTWAFDPSLFWSDSYGCGKHLDIVMDGLGVCNLFPTVVAFHIQSRLASSSYFNGG
jgi:hypothetical protein